MPHIQDVVIVVFCRVLAAGVVEDCLYNRPVTFFALVQMVLIHNAHDRSAVQLACHSSEVVEACTHLHALRTHISLVWDFWRSSEHSTEECLYIFHATYLLCSSFHYRYILS